MPSVTTHNPLRPVGHATLRTGQKASLLTDLEPDSDGRYTLYVDCGDTLHAVHSSKARVRCTASTDYGWIAMTDRQRIRVESIDEEATRWHAVAEGHRPPDITIRATDRGTVSRAIAPMSFDGSALDREHPRLDANDAKTLTSALTDAYAGLCATAADNGAWVQPLLARFHLVAADGRRIYSSEPTLLSAGGWQCCDPLEIGCTLADGTLATRATSLTARTFAIEVDVAALGSYDAASIEVTVTPQLHPVDFGAEADYRITRTSTSTPLLTAALPGVTAEMSDDSTARARLLRAMTERLAALESPLARLTCASSSGLSHAIANTLALTASAERKSLMSILARTVTSSSSSSPLLLRGITSPHSFLAGSSTTAGDAVMWADITPLHSPAALPRDPAATPSDQVPEWTGTLRVTLADGTHLDTLIGYPMQMPEALPPLVSYPDPQAVELELWVDNVDTGTVSHASAALTATADGQRAVSLDASLAATPLTPWTSGQYPVTSVEGVMAGRRRPGAVVSAHVSAPGEAVGALEITPAPVVALHPAVKSLSSWDFTRTHLYAFSPAGIFALSLGADRRRIGASLIDPRGVTEACHTAYTSRGVMAIARGKLLSVSASRVSELPLPFAPKQVAWLSSAGRVLLLGTDGMLRAYDPEARTWHERTVGHHTAEAIASVGADCFISCRDALLTPDTAGAATIRPISWSARLPLPRRAAPRHVVVSMSAYSFSGRVTCSTEAGPGSACAIPLVRLDIDGEVNAPLHARLPLTPRRYVGVAIEGMASADFTLTAVHLI